MTIKADASAEAKESYRKWYADNAEEHNAKRRAKYNPTKEELRSRAKKARAHRKSKDTHYEEMQVLYKGKSIRGYRIGHIAHLIDKPTHTIEYWENLGYIPKHTLPYVQRVYTQEQVDLIVQLAKVVPARRKPGGYLSEELQKAIRHVKENWENWDT